MSKRAWRGGMIGAGAWSEVQLTAWASVKNARIVALCDRHPERRGPIVDRFGIPQAFDDFESMLDEAEIDFVDVCTRPYSHAALTKLAAERGLPVLCQKPFCTSLDEAREVVEFCDQVGTRLMVNENYRWQAWYRKAKEVIASNALGRPFLARVHKRSRVTLPRFEHNQAYMGDMPRLIAYEMGVHYLDTFRYLFGEPETVFTRLHRVSPHVKGEDVQLTILGYKELTCLIDSSWASVPVPGLDRSERNWSVAPPRLEIDGSEGTLVLAYDGSMCLVRDDDRQQWQFTQDTVPESHVAAQQHFIDCLESGAQFETSGAETLKTMALVYACYRSAEQRRLVDPKALL
jgi:predicted dehydrogenase